MNETPRRTPGFADLARGAAGLAGRPVAFVAALLLVSLWLVSGPWFGWSGTWQLLINTSTTILTFLMIFLLQSTQNRDTEAVQLKLDEIIRALDNARDSMVSIEGLDEAELEALRKSFDLLARRARMREPLVPEVGSEPGPP